MVARVDGAATQDAKDTLKGRKLMLWRGHRFRPTLVAGNDMAMRPPGATRAGQRSQANARLGVASRKMDRGLFPLKQDQTPDSNPLACPVPGTLGSVFTAKPVGLVTMLAKLRQNDAWKFLCVVGRADRSLAWAWWMVLGLRGLLPALFALAMGFLVHAVERGSDLTGPLGVVAVVFLLLQVLSPLHQAIGTNLGSRTAAWLYDTLTTACVRPLGMGHLENPQLTTDLTMARDFDLGISGPPLFICMGFIASGLAEMIGGLASALVLSAYTWWAPPALAGAWLATHWLLRESAVWRDRNTEEVRAAERHADYAYRLAVDPPAAKELRLFGLDGWSVDRFKTRRRKLFDLRWEATRLRERPVLWSLLLVLGANVLVFARLASDAAAGRLDLAQLVTFATAAVGTSMIAFGGLSWALDSAAAPTGAVVRLEKAMEPSGALVSGKRAAAGMPAHQVRFRDLTFAYPNTSERVLNGFDLTIPAGSSLAIVGQNGAGKTTLAKLLCRLYDPQRGAIEIDGVDLREFDLEAWRSRITAVFQDFIRFQLPLRDNVAPGGAPDDLIQAALAEAGAARLAALDAPLSKEFKGGTDLSGGQWQRIALARALCAVKLGAGVVLLDEPTAQLDVRGEAEIFDRILRATRHTTTILISHRFSTVRQADRICVLELGKVVELGNHNELMALGGRYRTMFDLQASRFTASTEPQGEQLDETEG
jgi:ATP-binding cassette, subfamily B, bacterial